MLRVGYIMMNEKGYKSIEWSAENENLTIL